MVLKMKGLNSQKEAEKNRLLSVAIEKFHAALKLNTLNKVSLRNLADCYQVIGEHDVAKFYYEKAFNVDPKDTNSLYKFSAFTSPVISFSPLHHSRYAI